MNSSDEELMRRIRHDLIDSYDEELEMELEDRSAGELTGDAPLTQTAQDKENRRQYFRELFRLQGELVKLQDWVVSTGHKVVILFEGRDAAGKGGDQADYPTAQPAHLPCRRIAGTERP